MTLSTNLTNSNVDILNPLEDLSELQEYLHLSFSSDPYFDSDSLSLLMDELTDFLLSDIETRELVLFFIEEWFYENVDTFTQFDFQTEKHLRELLSLEARDPEEPNFVKHQRASTSLFLNAKGGAPESVSALFEFYENKLRNDFREMIRVYNVLNSTDIDLEHVDDLVNETLTCILASNWKEFPVFSTRVRLKSKELFDLFIYKEFGLNLTEFNEENHLTRVTLSDDVAAARMDVKTVLDKLNSTQDIGRALHSKSAEAFYLVVFKGMITKKAGTVMNISRRNVESRVEEMRIMLLSEMDGYDEL